MKAISITKSSTNILINSNAYIQTNHSSIYYAVCYKKIQLRDWMWKEHWILSKISSIAMSSKKNQPI